MSEPAAELAVREPRQLGIAAQPTLRLAIGYRDTTKRGNPPVKVEWFIAKDGADGEYKAAADRFRTVYRRRAFDQIDRRVAAGEIDEEEAEKARAKWQGPKTIDVRLPATLDQALQIQHKAWAGSGDDEGGVLRAIGETNFALTGWLGGPDTLTVWEPDGTVRKVEISGVDDAFAIEIGLKLYTAFRFHLPEVLGLTGWCEISTTSPKSTDNLYHQLRWLYAKFGTLVGELLNPKLVLRPATARPIIVKDGQPKRIRSRFWSLDLYVPDTIEDIAERLAGRSDLLPAPAPAAFPPDGPALGLPQTWQQQLEASAIERSLAELPPGDDEETRTREEPSAVDRPADDQLNRLAALESRADARTRQVLLEGAFGVSRADQLSAAEADKYEEALRIAVGDGEDATAESGELVDEPEPGEPDDAGDVEDAEVVDSVDSAPREPEGVPPRSPSGSQGAEPEASVFEQMAQSAQKRKRAS